MGKRPGLIYMLAFLVVAGTWALASCDSRLGTIEGTVTQDSDGEPVSAAQVVVFELYNLDQPAQMGVFQKADIREVTSTDGSGAYAISLEPDHYVVEVQAEGFELASSLVEVKGGRAATVDFALTPLLP
jgi:hypothetical protein